MNNNRGNNRRRGRGTNNRPQGGGQQVNRIDSRARGNAPQLLEKYRKLAHDAHLNGDRVNAEYYLQFADHYFRVIADTRLRQEEQRLRREERWQEGGEESIDDSSELIGDSDFPSYDLPPMPGRRDREERRDDRPREERRDDRRDDRPREERRDDRSRDDRPRDDRQRRPERAETQPREGEVGEVAQAADEAEQRSVYDPEQNPFVRDNRGTRGPRARREDARREDGREERRPRRTPRQERAVEDDAPVGLDLAALPPAISVAREETPAVTEAEAPAEEAKPRRRTRRPRSGSEDGGEALEVIN